MEQEEILKKESSKDALPVKEIKKNTVDYKLSHPYGYGRYESIAKQTFYVHTEAFIHIAGLCRRSRLPKDVWHRIEKTFLNSHGLSKLPIGIIVQEEIVPNSETGIMVRGGMSELLDDYVKCLDENLKENDEKVVKLIKKWEKIALDLQKKYKIKAKIGEEYDNSGRKRIKEDFVEKPIEWEA